HLNKARALVVAAEADADRARGMREAAQREVKHLEKKQGDRDLFNPVALDNARDTLKSAESAVKAAEAKVEEAKVARDTAELALKLTEVRVPVVVNTATSGSEVQLDAGPAAVKDPARKKYVILDRKVELNQVIGPPLSAHLFTLSGDLGRMQVLAQMAEA